MVLPGLREWAVRMLADVWAAVLGAGDDSAQVRPPIALAVLELLHVLCACALYRLYLGIADGMSIARGYGRASSQNDRL